MRLSGSPSSSMGTRSAVTRSPGGSAPRPRSSRASETLTASTTSSCKANGVLRSGRSTEAERISGPTSTGWTNRPAKMDILAEAVGRLFEGIVETLDMAGHASVDETWKEMDPRTLSFRVAAALPGAVDIRQELLETPDTASRLRREAELLMAVHRVEAETGAG